MLFNTDDTDGSEGEIDDDNEQDKGRRTTEEAQRIAYEQRLRKWNWELLIHNLSNGKITKYKEILSMNYIFILNWLSMKKELKIQNT